MRKREMTEEQLRTRNEIVDRLKNAEWRESASMSGFDDDEFLPEEVVMEYSGMMDLTVSYSVSEDDLVLVMEKGMGGEGLTLLMKCSDARVKVLDLVTSFQDKVNEENFRDYVVAIVDICPETYADRDDDGWVHLDNAAPRS